MPNARVIIEIDHEDGHHRVAQKPEGVEVRVLDRDELMNLAADDECVGIQHALWYGFYDEALRLEEALKEGRFGEEYPKIGRPGRHQKTATRGHDPGPPSNG